MSQQSQSGFEDLRIPRELLSVVLCSCFFPWEGMTAGSEACIRSRKLAVVILDESDPSNLMFVCLVSS